MKKRIQHRRMLSKRKSKRLFRNTARTTKSARRSRVYRMRGGISL